jgi:hypothetical protein
MEAERIRWKQSRSNGGRADPVEAEQIRGNGVDSVEDKNKENKRMI